MISLGVNDFSISLDACCSNVGDLMSGGVKNSWEKVVANIKELSKLTYITVGMVFSEENASQIVESVKFADNLGVADIRIISTAQWNDFKLFENLKIPSDILDRHPILKYRLSNFGNGLNVRGIKDTDSCKCGLMLDDMIIKGKFHYKCVIAMREGDLPIGNIYGDVRQDREDFYNSFNTHSDPICKKNCLDVCVDYNNRFEKLNKYIGRQND